MGNDWASLTSTLSTNTRIAWAQAVVENDKVRRWASALTRLHAISDFAGTGHSAGCEVISWCNRKGAGVQFKEFMGAMKYRHRPLVICGGRKDASETSRGSAEALS